MWADVWSSLPNFCSESIIHRTMVLESTSWLQLSSIIETTLVAPSISSVLREGCSKMCFSDFSIAMNFDVHTHLNLSGPFLSHVLRRVTCCILPRRIRSRKPSAGARIWRHRSWSNVLQLACWLLPPWTSFKIQFPLNFGWSKMSCNILQSKVLYHYLSLTNAPPDQPVRVQ